MVNTSGRTGGAAIAARRLASTLQNHGVYAKMLVANNEDNANMSVVALPHKWLHKWHFLAERLFLYAMQGFKRKGLFDIDPAMMGTDITRLREFKEADIIHLHWVNQGFLSLGDIRRILASGKPVVWTMHDMWPFTGVCHYVHDCERYKVGCGLCPCLTYGFSKDLSHRVWKKKQRLWNQGGKLAFVACSKWLAETALGSTLLANHRVENIVNPIDCKLYSPRDKAEARRKLGLPQNKILILFCAYNVALPIKGLAYLQRALELLVARDGEWRDKIGVLLVGKSSETVGSGFCVETKALGFVDDERLKAQIYNAADLFVIPSLQDNLPNTIVEAKASGLPVVGTRVGGIPRMIDHRIDGYIVEPQNAESLAEGIEWVIGEADLKEISARSRCNAVEQYSETAVAQKYIRLYEELQNKKMKE